MSSVQTFTVTALFDSNGPLSAPSLLLHPIQLVHHPPRSKRELSNIQIRSINSPLDAFHHLTDTGHPRAEWNKPAVSSLHPQREAPGTGNI